MTRSRLVYSTDGGRLPSAPSAPRPTSPAGGHRPPYDGIVRITRDRGNRGGKVVTAIHGLRTRGAALDALAAELKRFCGAGGTVRDGVIEIQGDHRERVAERLRALGHTVKLAGG